MPAFENNKQIIDDLMEINRIVSSTQAIRRTIQQIGNLS